MSRLELGNVSAFYGDAQALFGIDLLLLSLVRSSPLSALTALEKAPSCGRFPAW